MIQQRKWAALNKKESRFPLRSVYFILSSMAELTKKELEYLSGLARLSIEKKEEKLLDDLRSLLDYFKNLEELDTSEVEPMTGGTELFNILRKDEKGEVLSEAAKLVGRFKEAERGCLKVPAVFKKKKSERND